MFTICKDIRERFHKEFMVTLADLHKAPGLLRVPYYRESMEILTGRRKGRRPRKAVMKIFTTYGLVDSEGKPTIAALRALAGD